MSASMSAKETDANANLSQTAIADKSGGCVHCSRPESYDDFVQCDLCDAWWHMKCASVTGSVADRPWTCRNCIPVSIHSKSTHSSIRLALKLQKLAEECAIQKRASDAEKRAIEHEKSVIEQEKRLMQEKYTLLEEQLEEGDSISNRSRTSRQTSQQRVRQWVQEHSSHIEPEGNPVKEPAIVKPPVIISHQPTEQSKFGGKPATRLTDDRNHQRNNEISKTGPNQEEGCDVRAEGNPIPSAPSVQPPGKPPIISITPANKNTQPYQNSMLANLGSISPYMIPTRVVGTEPVQGHPPSVVPHPAPTGRNESIPVSLPTNNENANNNQSNTHSMFMLPRVADSVPSPSQLAARQIMPRDLPPFAGNPADWPVFISAFENSTAACGYSSVENLTRLQRCLKGAAYEAVRSRLLLPQSVPQVISTLRLLYGRPELLINVLLEKVRATPAPKAERLETLIEFGMAVQSLCDHLEAAGQQSHLSNPCLLMELVEKLPAHVKLEWAKFMQHNTEVNLKTFGGFMSGLVVAASQVTQYAGGLGKAAGVEKSRAKNKGAINTHIIQSEYPKDTEKQCCVCQGNGHRVRDCNSFKALSIDNRWKTAQTHELCRSCLNAHGRRSCRNATQCGINGCTFRHHPLLHSDRSNRPSRETVISNVELAGNHTHRQLNQSLLFRVVPITLYGPNTTVDTYAFLDDGSSLTLIEEELVNDMGIGGSVVPLCLTWTGDVSRMEAESKRLQLLVTGANCKKRLKLTDVRTVKKLSLPEQTLRINELEKRYTHLKGLPISSYEAAIPRILIGVNNLRLTLPLKVKEGDINEPVAMKTRLGWCVYGGSGEASPLTLNFHACECDKNLHNMVKDYFNAEDVATNQKKIPLSVDDKRALRILAQTTTRVGDRYQTGLLWRYDAVEFPDSYGMAVRRLECLERRMEKHPSLKENIHRQIDEYQLKGYTHRANAEELKSADPKRIWYLPLGAVINPKKPDKVRLIWDAAATVDGISLNSLLLKGPDQLTSLPVVLSRFRQYVLRLGTLPQNKQFGR